MGKTAAATMDSNDHQKVQKTIRFATGVTLVLLLFFLNSCDQLIGFLDAELDPAPGGELEEGLGEELDDAFLGEPVTFTKPDGADWTDHEYQDEIVPGVSLTRKNSKGLFNIASESGFDLAVSPADTEWAMGTTGAVIGGYHTTFGDALMGFIGQNILTGPMSLHILSTDQYFDVSFASWTSEGGGGFSYTRVEVAPPGDWVSDIDIPTPAVGESVTIDRPDSAYFLDVGSQDRITNSVWLVRSNEFMAPLFNYRQEAVPNLASGTSPLGTEWAMGPTADQDPATPVYTNFSDSTGNNEQLLSGQTLSLHVIEEDIYFDVTFSSYTYPSAGGGFAYTRTRVLPPGQ
jgi:hypothetical protein